MLGGRQSTKEHRISVGDFKKLDFHRFMARAKFGILELNSLYSALFGESSSKGAVAMRVQSS
jgi:hypothetical protein